MDHAFFGFRQALGLLILSIPFTLVAQSTPYPTRSVHLLIPAGAGGGVDTVARSLSAPLALALGQPVIADNRPGAGTLLAAELTAKAPPDGYLLLMATNSQVINASLHKSLRFDPIHDFSTISFVARLPYLLVIHPGLPVNSVKGLILLAQQKPGALDFSSAGSGSGTHLAFELFLAMAHIKASHVPYKSGSAALVDLAGGQVQMMMSNLINCISYVRAKRLVALGISTLKPSPLYPQIPTVAASGLPGFSAEAWYGVLAPSGVPKEILYRLNQEINRILNKPDLRERLATQGAQVEGSTPEAFATVFHDESLKWSRLTRSLALPLQ